jgi:hypothetical protein
MYDRSAQDALRKCIWRALSRRNQGTTCGPLNVRCVSMSRKPWCSSNKPCCKMVSQCQLLSVYWCPAALSCPHVGAGKKCKSQASTSFPKEATRISGSIIAPRAAIRCGLLFGLLTQRLKGRFTRRPRCDARRGSLSASALRWRISGWWSRHRVCLARSHYTRPVHAIDWRGLDTSAELPFRTPPRRAVGIR